MCSCKNPKFSGNMCYGAWSGRGCESVHKDGLNWIDNETTKILWRGG